MKRFLCLSLCLGLMASACKKKYTQEDLDKARAEGKASASGSGSGSGGGSSVTKKDKAAVIKACLPLINTHMRGVYGDVQNYFVLRQNNTWTPVAATPAMVIYSHDGMPFEFTVAHGFGETAAEATTNLATMAADVDFQGQFVARTDNAKGWRVFISGNGTWYSTAIASPAGNNTAPPAPDAGAVYKIFDRANARLAAARTAEIGAIGDAGDANTNDARAGWYDCVVDESENVTLQYTDTALV